MCYNTTEIEMEINRLDKETRRLYSYTEHNKQQAQTYWDSVVIYGVVAAITASMIILKSLKR